jgi:predicted acyl esterase
MARRITLLVALACAALPAAAQAEPAPYGLTCAPQDGVRICAAGNTRTPTFDGTPLDVDVTLPASGDGPFPTVVIGHGWGGSKEDPLVSSPTTFGPKLFARSGYAAITYSARGHGLSCGKKDPANGSPACANGYVHLDDQRWEIRDAQFLLGKLVDEGIAKKDALGATGGSYGGGLSLQMGVLKDRVRLPDGKLAPWTSPKGTPLSLAAAWPIIPWSDLARALNPNGRFLDFKRSTIAASRSPVGVPINSFITGLYATSGRLTPVGLDPSADLTAWKALTDQGEPEVPAHRAALAELTTYHSAIGLFPASGVAPEPAPILIQQGWTDDLFPAPEALAFYNELRRTRPKAEVALMFGDLGHMRGANKANTVADFTAQGLKFFDEHLKKSGTGPAAGSVRAFLQSCPKPAAAPGPYTAKDWRSLHPGAVRFGAAKTFTVTSSGGNPATAQGIDPVFGGGDACRSFDAEKAAGTATYSKKLKTGVTLLGQPTVRAKVALTGDWGQIAARLWDVSAGKQVLVARGNYRLTKSQKGTITFQLHGAGWKFAPGHTAKLELLGRDAPYYRASNGSFSVKVSKLQVELPLREKPSKKKGVSKLTLGK